MARKNILTSAPPFAVEDSLKRLGTNLRTARLRRNLTQEDVAEKIGTGVRAVMDTEKGKSSTSAAVYMALLWTYDMLDQMRDVASPELDEEGLSGVRARERERAREKKGLDDDF